ncbi:MULTISPECIES: type II toxin-antitoxin system VapB family antitoxin [Agrobacterium]|jgi:Arc/MetJ family transcription regulator|uniref:Type II toxin-antitoxin system VapB family antitoxin n=1 Tax=Agrobacterium pusense TaxID=648995 RepID=A0A1S9EIT7_9HYPH|nr:MULTISPECIES: type II toxin-antitoxin system VapB family antitoxin [Agrobacterium]AMD61265.1 transcriptional regulator [Agrobacterium tumefaciens]ANV24981.1 transcriptional regulator [Rhizobium sp. S41]AUC09318.1 transcriptional regulator [Rhizobium sp. Y9]KGE82079.1 transcriptional regulator [Rhizobium sp. H41]KIV68882.1 putative 8.2 KDA protein [Rhizobium sp. UR51a]MBB2904548.1 Arc/MetJ family transcription regulator [Rhizobium sp. RAS22]MBM7330359.1 type II toxin-antitoxin system VapB 
MRTNIDLDDALIAEAMEITGLSTKKATVEKALRDLVENLGRRKALEELRGIGWSGNLDDVRRSWSVDDIEAQDAAE